MRQRLPYNIPPPPQPPLFTRIFVRFMHVTVIALWINIDRECVQTKVCNYQLITCPTSLILTVIDTKSIYIGTGVQACTQIINVLI